MVATSQQLAAQAGLDILKKGGNAVDAGSRCRRLPDGGGAVLQRSWRGCLRPCLDKRRTFLPQLDRMLSRPARCPDGA